MAAWWCVWEAKWGNGLNVAEVLPHVRLVFVSGRGVLMRLKLTPWSCRGSAPCMVVVATAWDVPLLTQKIEPSALFQPCEFLRNVRSHGQAREVSTGIHACRVLNAYCRLHTTSIYPTVTPPSAFAPYAGLASNGSKVVQSMSDFFGDQHVLDQQVLGVYPQVDTSTSPLSENDDS